MTRPSLGAVAYFAVGLAACAYLSAKPAPPAPVVPNSKPLPVICRTPRCIKALIAKEARAAKIPASLALARAFRESGYNIHAATHESNGTWSFGVMQLNDHWFPEGRYLSPEANIRTGVRYLAALYRRCGGDAECAHLRYTGARVIR